MSSGPPPEISRKRKRNEQLKELPIKIDGLPFALLQQDILSEPEKRVVVSNLSSVVDENDIRTLFNIAGEVSMCSMYRDWNGHCLGKVQVVFKTIEGALGAIKRFNGMVLYGRQIKVGYDVVISQMDGGNVQEPHKMGLDQHINEQLMKSEKQDVNKPQVTVTDLQLNKPPIKVKRKHANKPQVNVTDQQVKKPPIKAKKQRVNKPQVKVTDQQVNKPSGKGKKQHVNKLLDKATDQQINKPQMKTKKKRANKPQPKVGVQLAKEAEKTLQHNTQERDNYPRYITYLTNSSRISVERLDAELDAYMRIWEMRENGEIE
ncbi:hypothetical protein RF11_00314 [Thelohanellus kitauei]|uniref:RRM domain-containing protein n=1 Tax=Thelohanellus kitauei TaxID=669202 RepID=A0A0C2MBY4_THEKT|nr:hypothetical protein RF11_00314 [Thelohanellus kitauei]